MGLIESWALNCGVPLESVLDPFLFFVYINNLPQSLSESLSYPYLYADGTCIFYQDKDTHEIEHILKSFQHSANNSLIQVAH